MSARSLVLVALCVCACGPVELGKLTLKLTRGSVDPLNDPGDAQTSARPVAALRLQWDSPLVKWPNDAGVITVPLGAASTLKLDLPAPAEPARLTVEGLLDATQDVWSLGRSVRIEPPSGTTPSTVTVLLGRADGFTSTADQSPRFDAQVVRCGLGALVVGGGTTNADGGVTPNATGALFYDATALTLAPVTAPGTVGGIAVTLTSGAVLHGLGRHGDGQLSNTLFLTKPNGDTAPVTLSGASLEARQDAAALQLTDGTVLVLGGQGASGALSGVARLTLDEAGNAATVNALAALPAGRARAGAVQLSTGEVVLLGGVGAGDVKFDDGVWVDLTATTLTWRSASNRMSVGRVSPQVVRLEDDSVLAWGGGDASGDVFSMLASTDGAFVKLAVGAVTVPADTRLVRAGRSVLFAGGERGIDPPFAARFVAAVQTPSVGQQYAGTWSRLASPVEARLRGGLARIDDGSVVVAGGSAAHVEVFTPTKSLLDGD